MKKFQSKLTVKKKKASIILFIAFFITELLSLLCLNSPGLQLICCSTVFLNFLLLFCLTANISADNVKSFLNSTKEKLLLIVYIASLSVSFFLIPANGNSLIRTEQILFFFTLLLTGLCISLLFCKKESKVSQMFVIVFLIAASMFDLAMPLGEVPDEQSHLETAYRLSDTIMGIHSETPKRIFMREYDADFKRLEKNITGEKYENYLDSASLSLENDNLVQVKSHALTRNDYLYIFPALGITVGRILHMNSFWTFNLGRICNMILVCVLAGIAIQMVPVGKNVIFLVFLTPTSLQQSMSYSYDAPINAFGVLLIAYSIRKIYETEYRPSRIEKILIIAGIWTAFMSKGHAYFLLGLLPVIVWLRGRSSLPQEKKNKLVQHICIASIATIVFICSVMFIVPAIMRHPVLTNEKNGYSLWYIAEHPGKVLSLIAGTIRYSGITYFTTFFGKWLGWFEINIGNIPVLLLFISLILAVVSEKEKIKAKDGRVLCCVISIGIALCIFGGFLLTYTSLEAVYIEGVQGRYFILPVILLLTAIAGKIKQHLEVPQSLYGYAVLLSTGLALFKILAFYA